MRLVHLGDLHFYRLGLWPWQLLSKRLLGQANLWLNRRRHFHPQWWPHLADRVRSVRPDLILASGDFTTTALPGEFAQAAKALAEMSALAPLHAVPGNHDRYTFAAHRRRDFERALGAWSAAEWPSHWCHDGVHVLGLDPTKPRFFHASGELGQSQLDRLRKILAEIPASELAIVLCHYPLGTPPDQPPEPHHHALRDADALRAVLAETRRPLLYLHGHIHRQWAWRPPDAANVLAINGGAPMMTDRVSPWGQGFLEIELAEVPRVWRHAMTALGEWRREPLHTTPGG